MGTIPKYIFSCCSYLPDLQEERLGLSLNDLQNYKLNTIYFWSLPNTGGYLHTQVLGFQKTTMVSFAWLCYKTAKIRSHYETVSFLSIYHIYSSFSDSIHILRYVCIFFSFSKLHSSLWACLNTMKKQQTRFPQQNKHSYCKPIHQNRECFPRNDLGTNLVHLLLAALSCNYICRHSFHYKQTQSAGDQRKHTNHPSKHIQIC